LVFAAIAFVACDSRPDPEPQASPAAGDPADDPADGDDPVSALDSEIGPANSCRVPPQSCSSSQKCCSGAVCLNDDLTPDPAPSLKCRPCGKADELCCGQRRAHSLKELAKRCNQKGFVCPQSESSDICEPCGEEFQHCCLEKGGKTSCKSGLKCQGVGKGGKNKEAFPGTCR
jgi:hypothetical protein